MSDLPPRWLASGLSPVAWLYGGAMRARNALFDRGLRRATALPVPVISVGNLTVGGTGKTPLVMWLVENAMRLGRKPGVLARGYGRAPGALLNDEGAMLAARFPGLTQVQDPDRVRGGQALAAQGVDVIILDDGFQHRRVRRDCDIVCLDAGDPLAGGRMLPAGLLREPPDGLSRADVAVLTRAGGLEPDQRAAARALLERYGGPQLAVFAADHAPRDVVAMPTGEVLDVGGLRGQRVGLLSAIARPTAFEGTVKTLGADVVWSERRRDHHRFSADEIAAIGERARTDDVRLVVTEKDEPKLAGAAPSAERWVLRIDMVFVGETPTPEALGLT